MGQDADRPVVWVTGGAGYIGANVVRALIRRKATPIVIDNFSTGHKAMLPERIGVLDVDIASEPSTLREMLGDAVRLYGKPRSVIHLAAESRSNICESVPSMAYKINVVGTYNFAEACSSLGVRNMAFASSAAVYGKPLGIYGQTKLDAENLLKRYFKNFHTVAFRVFNVAGSAVSASHGVTPLGRPSSTSSAIFPALARAVLSDKKFTCGYIPRWYGHSIPVRDFIHVQDVARAFANWSLYGGSFPDGMGNFHHCDLGRGIPIKISDLLELAGYTKQYISEGVLWEPILSNTHISYSVAKDPILTPELNLACMWQDELRWQRSRLYMKLRSEAV